MEPARRVFEPAEQQVIGGAGGEAALEQRELARMLDAISRGLPA